MSKSLANQTGITGSQALPGNPRPRGSASRPAACTAYADQLVDLSDGELSGAEGERVLAHVAECMACRGELARLDRSLACLRNEAAALGGRGSRRAVDLPQRHSSTSIVGSQIAIAGAAGLACLLAAVFAFWPDSPNTPAPTIANVPKPSLPAPVITQVDALRRIALLEQQARLQTSLDLMPQADWYQPQRAANERLLDSFKAAADEPMQTTGETL